MTDAAATLLLVEDDDATRTFLADNLSADGYELLVADCARDATRLLETKFPDLALVDVGLPDGSGFDLVGRVREADGLASRIDPRTPIIVVSGRADELDRIRGFERGCDDYVCKPFSYPELRGLLSSTGRNRGKSAFKYRSLMGLVPPGAARREPRPTSGPSRCAHVRRGRGIWI